MALLESLVKFQISVLGGIHFTIVMDEQQFGSCSYKGFPRTWLVDITAELKPISKRLLDIITIIQLQHLKVYNRNIPIYTYQTTIKTHNISIFTLYTLGKL